MANDRRDTLTLAWSGNGTADKAQRVDDYVELPSSGAAAQSHQRRNRRVAPIPVDESRLEFERRMENWRRTVRSAFGRGAGGCCASWAAMYVASRSKDGNGDEPAPPRMIVSVDELDGWLIEAAVRSMRDFNEKQALRYQFVWQYPEHWIRSKLMLRATALRFVLARAERSLQEVLARLEDPATILSNNLHAGVDPRPESTDALVGAALTLKTADTLID